MNNDQIVNSASTLPTKAFGDPERDIFETFAMDTISLESIPQIKKSLLKKHDLARSLSETVQKCRENITYLREKLTKEPIGTEMPEKEIHQEYLDQMENSENEPDFLKKSLKRAEDKLMVKPKSAVKSKTTEDEYSRASCEELGDFLTNLEGDGSGFHEVVKSPQKHTSNYLVGSLNYPDLSIKDISRKLDTPPSTSENGDFDLDLENPYIRCSEVDNHDHKKVASLLRLETESFESLPGSTRSGTGSGYTTSRSQKGDKHEQSHKGESKHNLIKSDDTPAFLEFMKAVPLTGDIEVDDEIFKFYRTKFKR